MKIAEGIELDVQEFNRALGRPHRSRLEEFGGIACPDRPIGSSVQDFSRGGLREAAAPVADSIKNEIKMLTSELQYAAKRAQQNPSRGASDALMSLVTAMGNIVHNASSTDPKFKELDAHVKALVGKIPRM